MDLAREITFSELYSCEEDLEKAVVLKDLPGNSDDLDFLTNYLDVVIGEDGDLVKVCHPIPIPTALIAIFDQVLPDVEKYDATLDKRKCKGRRIILEKIGQPAGIFLRQLPSNVDDDFLHLYFESKKKCGYDCEVKYVKVKVNGEARLAIVAITDEIAVQGILSKPSCSMRNNDVALEPYFPAYHDYLLEHLPGSSLLTQTEEPKQSSTRAKLVIIDPDSESGPRKQLYETDTEKGETQITPQCHLNSTSHYYTLIRETNESQKEVDADCKAKAHDLDEDTDSDVVFHNNYGTSEDESNTSEGTDSSAAAADDDDNVGDDDEEEEILEEKCNSDDDQSHPYAELNTGDDQSHPSFEIHRHLEPPCHQPLKFKSEMEEHQPNSISDEKDHEKQHFAPKKPVSLFDCLVDDENEKKSSVPYDTSLPLPSDQGFVSEFPRNVSQFQGTGHATFPQCKKGSNPYCTEGMLHGKNDTTTPQSEVQFTRNTHEALFASRPFENTAGQAVKPAVAMVKPSFSVNSTHQGRASDPSREKKSEDENIETELSVLSSKIILLKITKYEHSKKNENVKMVFNDRQGKIVIKGQDCDSAKLRLYESLNGMVERTENISRQKCNFLSQKECLDHIKFICKKNNLKVVITVDTRTERLVCLGMSEDDAVTGLKLVKDRIHTHSVKLRPGQIDILAGPKWQQFLENFKGSLLTIFVSENKDAVIIEGFKKVSEIIEEKQKVVQFLKDNVVKATTKIELNGAKAKCFQKYLQQGLESDIQQKHGKITVDVIKKDYPMKISLCIHGEVSVIDHTKSVLEQIWHEKFDFTKVSSDKLDMWLIMKGLGGEHGRPFFRKFEQDQNCCIDVTESGQVPPPPIQVKQHVVSQPADSLYQERRVQESHSFQSIYKEDDAEVIYRRSRPSYAHLQQPMSEAEAFQMAMAMSLEENDGASVCKEDVAGSSFDEQAEEDDWEPTFTTKHNPVDRKYTSTEALYGDNSSGTDYDDDDDDDENLEDDNLIFVKSMNIKIGNTDVSLKVGEISKFSADCLVNFVSPSWKLEEGTVSKGIIKAAGPQLIADFQRNLQSLGGKCIETTAGNLSCQSVLHVQLSKGPQNCHQAVQTAVSQALNMCARNGYTSIVFPPLGLGRMYQYPAATIAKSMLGAIQMSSSNFSNVSITIVVFDDSTFKPFRTEFQTWQGNKQPQIPGLSPFQRNNNQYRSMPQSRPLPPRPRHSMQRPLPSFSTQSSQLPPQPVQIPQSLQQMPFGSKQRPRQLPQRQTSVEANFSGNADQPRRLNRVISPVQGSPSQSRGRGMGGIQKRRPTERLRRSKSTEDLERQMKDRKDQRKVHKAETPSTKREHKSESKFPKDTSAKKLSVVIYSADKEKCMKARNALCKAINDEFLFQESLKKAAHINDETKLKIVRVVTKYQVKSIAGKECFFIKGHKDSVNKAIKEIYEVLFEAGSQSASSAQEKRKRRTGMKRETKEYVKFMVEEDPDVPHYWKHWKPGNPIKSAILDIKMAVTGKKYKKVDLDPEDKVYKCIIKMMNSTWDIQKKGQGKDAAGLDQIKYSKLFVTKIQRIENLDLYHEYANRRIQFFLTLFKQQQARYTQITKIQGCTQPIQTSVHAGGPLLHDINPEVNEFYFFHGTKPDNVSTICAQGLDNRLASGQAMFGPGIYGAETCTKADQYADDKASGRVCGNGKSLQMFLIRIILGDAYICTNQNPHKYKRPPCRECYTDGCKKHKGLFDSVIGDCGKLFREFVVYSKEQCYPEYLITYERR